jgi:hypothetical protein
MLYFSYLSTTGEKMKKPSLLILTLSLLTLGFFLTPVSSAAQTPDTAPKIVMVVSLQQDSLLLGDQAAGVVEISNQSDVGADNALFDAALPDFLVLHAGSCDSAAQTSAIDLGSLPAHSVKTQAFCLNLNPSLARAGSFNLLFKITYTWGQKTDLATAEKTVTVDLIGSQTILGLPLAFAGFILPGLMFLLALRWFKWAWVLSLSGEDKLVYSVLLSLLLLGPFSWLGNLISLPGLAQLLNFSQQVTIERLVAYLVIGYGFGLLVGWGNLRLRSNQENKIKVQDLSITDDPKTIIQKALLMNPDYMGGHITFRNKQNGIEYWGAHYVIRDTRLYIFSEFRLNGSKLDARTQARVNKLIGTAKFGTDARQILGVLSLISHLDKDLIQVSNPVFTIGTDGVTSFFDPGMAFVQLIAADYNLPTLVKDDTTVLLDIQI